MLDQWHARTNNGGIPLAHAWRAVVDYPLHPPILPPTWQYSSGVTKLEKYPHPTTPGFAHETHCCESRSNGGDNLVPHLLFHNRRPPDRCAVDNFVPPSGKSASDIDLPANVAAITLFGFSGVVSAMLILLTRRDVLLLGPSRGVMNH